MCVYTYDSPPVVLADIGDVCGLLAGGVAAAAGAAAAAACDEELQNLGLWGLEG